MGSTKNTLQPLKKTDLRTQGAGPPRSRSVSGLQPLKKADIRMQVFAQMKNQILTGAWKPGDQIPSENELANLMGVSRISVREALQKLVALDLLETRHGEGTFVKTLTADLRMNSLIPMMFLSKNDILDVLVYRRIMEKGIIGLAIDRAEENDLAELESLLGKMREASNQVEEFAGYDLDFHLTLARMTRNPIIIKINYIIKDILSSSMKGTVDLPGADLGLHYHTEILEAIKRREKDLAQKLMEEHIESTISCVLEQKK